ncbi:MULTISPECIES: hypothetical protein [Pantoea]|uniref:hypothetical protein n=1 Tax=Pantoea TaxID=53335 RepID=UPI0014151A49|nr:MULTISPECIES: hypothetical protein [Pantoea]
MENEFLHIFFFGQLASALSGHPTPQRDECFTSMMPGACAFFPPDKRGSNYIQFFRDVLQRITVAAHVCKKPEPVDFMNVYDGHFTSPDD